METTASEITFTNADEKTHRWRLCPSGIPLRGPLSQFFLLSGGYTRQELGLIKSF